MRLFLSLLLIISSPGIMAQSGQMINNTDAEGRKQGKWIKEYPDGNILYEGSFKDDKPSGEFKRYYTDGTLQSLLVYSENGDEAAAAIYYPNGFIASKGRYVNKAKEGKWQFFSFVAEEILISEEEYSKGVRNGLSINYYPDRMVAVKQYYSNGVRHGEFLKYHNSGSVNLKASYVKGKLDGSFEAYFENGNPELNGQYKGDLKEGTWLIYKEDGTLRFKIEYAAGVAKNRDLDIYETEYIETLEKNRVEINDPEKTGEIW